MADSRSFNQVLTHASQSPRRIITLLTDFGTADGFVGVMKGVMLQIAPETVPIDITHDLPAQSIESAAFLNEWSYGYFPGGTVHLCVVDPGVGTGRRMMILEQAGHLFVAPDNGLLTPLLLGPEPRRIVSITNRKYWLDRVSATFHGRDIFSPVAAHLASGIPILEMGEAITDPVLLPWRLPRLLEDRVECQVVYIDRFGNLVTNLDQNSFLAWLEKRSGSPRDVVIHYGEEKSKDCAIHSLSRSYGEKATGELLAVFDGYDRLEIAACNGNAAEATGLRAGCQITVGLSG